jgi:hypothetical protein
MHIPRASTEYCLKDVRVGLIHVFCSKQSRVYLSRRAENYQCCRLAAEHFIFVLEVKRAERRITLLSAAKEKCFLLANYRINLSGKSENNAGTRILTISQTRLCVTPVGSDKNAAENLWCETMKSRESKHENSFCQNAWNLYFLWMLQ